MCGSTDSIYAAQLKPVRERGACTWGLLLSIVFYMFFTSLDGAACVCSTIITYNKILYSFLPVTGAYVCVRARSRHSVEVTWREDVSRCNFTQTRTPSSALALDVGFCATWRLETRNNSHIYDIVRGEGESSKITGVIENLSNVHRVHYYYYFITENNNAQFDCVLDLDFAGVCVADITGSIFNPGHRVRLWKFAQ